MKSNFLVLLLLILLCVPVQALDHISGEVLVKFKPQAATGAISSLGLTILETNKELRVYRISVPQGKSVEQYVAEISLNNAVEYAEPNHILRAFATIPNDPSYGLQWGLPLIYAPEAWDITHGSSSVIVAVIDSGIDKTHPDLINKIYGGYNFYDGNSDYSDINGHGSHVSGIIAAETSNSIGIAGVSWGSKIMALRIMDSLGDSDDLKLANALIYAADNGAKVINMSLGGSSYSHTMADAVLYAYNKGCVMVAATGNENNSTPVSYPAALSQVMAITAVNQSKTVTSYSNTGSEVDVCAPGGTDSNGIYSTIYGNSYGYKFGTSMATPHVAGLAALLFSKFPTIGRDGVIYAITSEAEDLGSAGKDNYSGYGLINLVASLVDIVTPEVTIIKPVGNETLMKNASFIITWSATDVGRGLAANPISIYFSSNNGSSYSVVASSIANTGTYSWTVPQTPTTQAKIKISAIDVAGNMVTKESNNFSILDIDVGIYAYPNPLKSGNTLTFLGLTGNETIRFYDINGDLVRTITNGNTWDAKNSNNSFCSEGIYFYVITYDLGALKKGKIILLR